MSNAFIHGLIASESWLSEFHERDINEKYGHIEDVDFFLKAETDKLYASMVTFGLAQKDLDLIWMMDNLNEQEQNVVTSIKQYQGSKAGCTYRDAFLESYQQFKSKPVLDFEKQFDENLMMAMKPYLDDFVGIDGILAYCFFKRMELKNIGIALRGQKLQMHYEGRLRYGTK